MDKQREMFEAWYSKHCEPGVGPWFVRDKDNSNEYYMSHTQTAWDAWQAAIAAQQDVTPDVVDLAAMIMSDCGISTVNSGRLQARIAARIATYASGIDLKAMVANGFDANSGKCK